MSDTLENVFGEALWEVLRRVASASFADPPPRSAVAEAVEEGLEAAVETLAWDFADPRLEEVCLFLGGPEVRSLVQQVFASSLSNRPRARQTRETFLALWGQTFDDAHTEEAGKLWQAIIEAAGKSIGNAIETNVLAAHEAASARRHNVLLDYLDALQRNMELLLRGRPLILQRVNDFAGKYVTVALLEHGTITPPSLDQEVRIPINNLYVFPTFVRHQQSITYDALTASLDRAVIRGNPGAGKSTLSSRIAYDVLEKSGDLRTSGRLPIVVALHAYGEMKVHRGWTLVSYIEHVIQTKYQVAPPKGVTEFILLNGRAMVILDGLDELIDAKHRKEVRNDVEKFATLYPAARIIVTSREIGYEQAPLSEAMFHSYTIAPFDEPQVSTYVSKWYEASGLPRDEVSRRTARFLEESKRVPDLASNPLMLALMCNIHRGGELPPNRPALYRECALMMFERWDKSRGIKRDLPYPTHLEKILRYLAEWLFDNTAKAAGVTHSELVTKVSAYIRSQLNEDPIEAQSAAEKWIDFFRGRAWVLTALGSTTEESLYHFAHPTFLEFFAASELVSRYPTPESLVAYLLPYLERAERDVVAQLAFQLQSATIGSAADFQIGTLLDVAASRDAPVRQTVLSFAFRTLEFLVPSPATLRRVVAALESEFLQASAVPEKKGSERQTDARSAAVLAALLFNSATDNRVRLVPELQRAFTSTIESGRPEAVRALATASVYLPNLVNVDLASTGDDILMEAAVSASNAILEGAKSPIKAFAKHSHAVARQLLLVGEIPIEGMARNLGLESLFAAVHLPAIPTRRFGSVAEELLRLLRSDRVAPGKHRVLERTLEGVTSVFNPVPSPFVAPLGVFAPAVVDRSAPLRASGQLSPDAKFGVFLLLAVLAECQVDVGGLADELSLVFRFEPWAKAVATQAVDSDGDPFNVAEWSRDQNDLVSRWATRELRFTRDPHGGRPGVVVYFDFSEERGYVDYDGYPFIVRSRI